MTMSVTTQQRRRRVSPHVELRLHGRRLWLHRESLRQIGWLRVERLLWIRRTQCSNCPLLRRWFRLWWCGDPMPLRVMEISPVVVRAIVAGLGLADDADVPRAPLLKWRGCGCNLNLKWTMLFHPAAHARRWLGRLIESTLGVEGTERNMKPLACPLGRWPRVAGECGSSPD